MNKINNKIMTQMLNPEAVNELKSNPSAFASRVSQSPDTLDTQPIAPRSQEQTVENAAEKVKPENPIRKLPSKADHINLSSTADYFARGQTISFNAASKHLGNSPEDLMHGYLLREFPTEMRSRDFQSKISALMSKAMNDKSIQNPAQLKRAFVIDVLAKTEEEAKESKTRSDSINSQDTALLN